MKKSPPKSNALQLNTDMKAGANGSEFLLSFHHSAPVDVKPSVELSCWSLKRVKHADGTRSLHLVGKRAGNSRVSSPIVSLDFQAMEGATESGRLYKLEGQPGSDTNSQMIYSIWLGNNGWHHQKDLTGAFVRLSRMRGFA